MHSSSKLGYFEQKRWPGTCRRIPHKTAGSQSVKSASARVEPPALIVACLVIFVLSKCIISALPPRP